MTSREQERQEDEAFSTGSDLAQKRLGSNFVIPMMMHFAHDHEFNDTVTTISLVTARGAFLRLDQQGPDHGTLTTSIDSQ